MPKKTQSPVLREKEYPSNYPDEAVQILEAMSFGKGLQLVGSMSLRSQQYAGDYDGYEVVERHDKSIETALSNLRQEFQSIIKKLRSMPNVYIGDIKSGVIEEWRVIPKTAGVKNEKIVGYNSVASKARLDTLLKSKVITKMEYEDAFALLKDAPTIPEFLQAKATIKFHIIRWSVLEVLKNAHRLRNGRVITLEECFHTPGITKLDVIGLVQRSRYTDFSIIYEFRNNGRTLNPEKIDISQSLEENIIAYLSEGNYFKVLKRLFALAKYTNDIKTAEELTPILNSDLGRLYHITSDIGTLETLLEEHSQVPIATIRYEIDQFKSRLSNIYTLKDYLKDENTILGEINTILRKPERQVGDALSRLGDKLNTILQKYSKPIVERLRRG
jgi:hypothetical protein